MGASASSTTVLNFTSALYLGLHHSSGSLRPWPQLTTGVPAALAAPPDAGRIAHQLAQLQGCEHGVLGTSTFHLFWDLFGILAQHPVAICVDAGLYPIARWGVERAAGRGVPVYEFAHHDPEALHRRLIQNRQGSLQPLVVTDGFCPGCGRPAPLSAYLESVRASGGRLIVDDTQALGIFGHSHASDAPYGREGGGMLKRMQIGGPDVVAISSLAKAFGAPVAVLSGSGEAVAEFETKSETRMHCSPPSLAVIRAAEHALCANHQHGDRLRLRLARLVMCFRQSTARAGFRFTGGLFPVQTLASASQRDTLRSHERLLQHGIRTILRRAAEGQGLRISFVITARHTPEAIDRAVTALSDNR
jgi:8-amino-7-oxononanoate synthase